MDELPAVPASGPEISPAEQTIHTATTTYHQVPLRQGTFQTFVRVYTALYCADRNLYNDQTDCWPGKGFI